MGQDREPKRRRFDRPYLTRDGRLYEVCGALKDARVMLVVDSSNPDAPPLRLTVEELKGFKTVLPK